MKERVQKLMAQANIGSRRACEELIRAGRVTVNGNVIQLGAKADPDTDTIMVDRVKLSFAHQRKIYVAFNKPINVVSSNVGHHSDKRKTVRQMVPLEGHLFTIGRLDADSDGLMVLTNDGSLANRLSHPRYGHTKTYKAVVYGLPGAETIERWEQGVYLEEEKTAPCSVRVMQHSRGLTTLRIVMSEGKKRQIRRVAKMLGYPVRRLTRTHIGGLALGSLKPGEWRELTPSDVEAMQMPAPEERDVRRPSPRSRAADKRPSRHKPKSPGPRRPAMKHRSGQRRRNP